MSNSGNLKPFFYWTVLGVILGILGAVAISKQYVSTAELAVDTEALAPAGLARFERLNISDGSEVETLVQMLKSSRLSGAAAEQLGQVSRTEIEESLKIIYDQGSPIVKVRITTDSDSKSQSIARALVDQAMKLDSDRKQLRTREAIDAVKTQLSGVEKQLAELNGEIQKLTADREIVLSNDPERQHRAATELAQLTERLGSLNVEGSALAQRGRRLAELITSLPTTGAMPSGFAVEEADKSPALAETRKRLLDQESEVASLRSRYGARHAKVEASEAEVAATKKTLRDLLHTQQTVVQAQIADNTNAQKIIEKQIGVTEMEARQSDFSLDPKHASLMTRREALAGTYAQLSTRLTELMVFAAARPATFYLFSEPSVPNGPSRLRPAATFAALALLGAILGFCHCMLRWKQRTPNVADPLRPEYAQP